jgi:PadR family transcriptional regulator AphA
MATVAELSATGRVILGMLALGKNTGYEIKQFVDKSTRHFWAASYGQIYPELRRLEELGLVSGHPEPSGGRARTVYELTDAGHAALRAWLRNTGEPVYEVRCETLLKLFFSDAVEPRYRVQYLRDLRELQERKLEQLRAIEGPASSGPEGPYLSLQFGLAQTEWLVNWCRESEQRLAARIEKE